MKQRLLPIQTSVLMVALILVGRASAALTEMVEESPEGKMVKKELVQIGLRTAGKETLKRVIVAKEVFDTTYSATRAVINAPSYYDAGVAIITGIQQDKAWAVAGTEVECFGLELVSNVGQNQASASHSQACSLHGSSAAAQVQVSRGTAGSEDFVSVVGHAKAPSSWLLSPEAHWLGMGGVGDKLVIDSDVLDIVEKVKQTILDPKPSVHSSWLEGQSSQQAAADSLSQLYSPAGFSLLTRVYLPTVSGEDYYLFYEAEVSAALGVADREADLASEFFGVDMFVRADYYDESGGITRTLQDAAVCSLTPENFQYFENTVDTEGQSLDVFGFALNNFDLGLSVELPTDRDKDLPMYVDMEVLAGSQAIGTPVPEPSSAAYMASVTSLWLVSAFRRRVRSSPGAVRGV